MTRRCAPFSSVGRLPEQRPPIKDAGPTTACAAFSNSDRLSRGPSVRPKPAKNIFWSSSRASRSFRSNGCDANSRQFTKPSQSKSARWHPEASGAAASSRLAATSKSKRNRIRPQFVRLSRRVLALRHELSPSSFRFVWLDGCSPQTRGCSLLDVHGLAIAARRMSACAMDRRGSRSKFVWKNSATQQEFTHLRYCAAMRQPLYAVSLRVCASVGRCRGAARIGSSAATKGFRSRLFGGNADRQRAKILPEGLHAGA